MDITEEDIKDVKKQLNTNIHHVKEGQKIIEKRLKEAKADVTESIVEGIFSVMDEQDFMNNKSFSQYCLNNTRHSNDRSTRTDWINSLSRDEQIEILAEYGIDDDIRGHNDWERKIADAQKAKDITKKALAVQATKVIASYRKLLQDHEKVLQELEKDIKQVDRDIQAKTKELADMKAEKGKVTITSDAVTVIKDEVERLRKNKEELEKKLTILKGQTSEYRKKIEKAISDLQESLKKEGIYVGDYQGLDNPSSTQSALAQNANVPFTGQAGGANRTPKEIAKAMMNDFDNLAPSEIAELMDQFGYQDLLDMSRDLGPINRKKLRTAMELILSDRPETIEAGTNNIIQRTEVVNGNPVVTCAITRDQLTNIKDLSDEQFRLLTETMRDYEQRYNEMSVHERAEADRIMEYIKISVLLTESHTSKPGRFLRKLNSEGKRIEMIGNELRRFANTKGERENARYSKSASLRQMLKVKTPPQPRTGRKAHVDKSGIKSIQR